MRQFARFKRQHPDCILFFRMGDFYETFNDDAVTAHKALGITLTQRTEGVPMAGVPFHAVESYLRRMIEQGYRVAVCDQIQDPKEAKGIVERAVTRVLTPGTLVDESLLDEALPNQVAAVHWPDGPAGTAVLAAAELSTGAFVVLDLAPATVVDEIVRLAPSELLFAEPREGGVPAPVQALQGAVGCALTPRPDWTFRPADAAGTLREHFGVGHLEGFGFAEDDPAITAAGGLLRYLQETQAPDGAEPGRLGHLRPPVRRTTSHWVMVDATSLRSLEIERTMRSGQVEGSLLWVLQRCATPMGKRLLRQWLCFPPRDLETVESRQRCVGVLVEDEPFADRLAVQLGAIQDVARIGGRLGMGRATPRDLVAVGASVGRLTELRSLLDGRPAFAPLANHLAELAGRLLPLAEHVTARCVDAPPAHLREGGLFRDGVDDELDEARLLQRDANDWLARYQKQLIEQTGIPSLKVGYNKVFGYYIEITHAHHDKVPDAFSRKQTLKNAERYITPELKTFEDKVTTAEARAIEREKQLFDELCTEARGHGAELSAYAEAVAELDVLACFADVSRRYGYVRPTVVDEPVLDVRQGRHPVLDRILEDRFVPNDCALGRSAVPDRTDEDPTDDGAAGNAPAGTLAIITGPNMAGKSTYIRQVALIALMAHTGCFVPAESATVGLMDRLFTRIGASDELHAGQSTFMVEMTETANILHHATDRSLVILDEIGRGTSTLDGLSLAWAIAEAIAARGCRALFATHYHELTTLADRLDRVTNLHVSVREWGEEVIFLYRILPGRTDRSYGIHVAKIAGLPRDTIARAAELLETLAVHTEPGPLAAAVPASTPPGGQMGLFTEYLQHPALEQVRTLDLERLSPMQAFDELRRLKEAAEEGS
jgi:DNA mismatch repair protein MutS